MSEVTITVRPNGPYKVTGPVQLIDPEGNPVPLEPGKPAIFLCRCGQSAEKPFCDGAHKECGFRPDAETA
jgi:CDGSH-type Zn-finger protein